MFTFADLLLAILAATFMISFCLILVLTTWEDILNCLYNREDN